MIAFYSSLITLELLLAFPLTFALDLSGRNLMDIPTDINPEETNLDLSKNMLTTIKAGAFSSLKNLTSLWLYSNQINTVESGAFDGLSRLELLHIGGNKLDFVPDMALLPKLKTLVLISNPLSSTELRNENFRDVVYLEVLNIAWTLRIYFPPFPHLQNMKRLSLVGNQMRNTPPQLFRSMPNLEAIWLHHNRLSSIPISQSFTGQIRTLGCAHNRIYHIPDLSSFPRLRQLDLSFNYISAVPEVSLSTMIGGSVLLEGNPVQCVPELCWLRTDGTSIRIRVTCLDGRSWTELHKDVICEGL